MKLGSNLELVDILMDVCEKLRGVQGERGDFLKICGVRKCWTGNFLRDLRREMVDEELMIEIQEGLREPQGSSVYILLVLLAHGPVTKSTADKSAARPCHFGAPKRHSKNAVRGAPPPETPD